MHRRLFAVVLPVLSAGALTLPAAPAAGHDGGTATRADDATVTLRENRDSGISGTLRIDGRDVRGQATGLTPGKRYITLYYGDQSTDRPDQANTCADVRTAATPQQWGSAPEWRVRAGGSGRLRATAPRTVQDEPAAVTASIREVPATASADPYVGFNPLTYSVVACGRVMLR